MTDELLNIDRKSASQPTLVFASAEKTKQVYLNLMRQANSEILLIFPTVNTIRRQKQIGVLEELIRARRRGVQTRILAPADDFLKEDLEQLKSCGIEVRIMEKSTSGPYFGLLMVDRSYSMKIEVRDDSKKSIFEAIGESTFSTSKATVLPYVTIFQSFWQSAEVLEKQRAIDRAKNEFINIAAHELRTPLLPLSAAVDYFEEDIKRLKDIATHQGIADLEKIADSLQSNHEIMRRSTHRLLKTSEDILHVSLIETGAFKLKLQETNLDQLIESSIAETKKKYAFSKRHVECVYNRGLSGDNSAQIMINCDAYKIGLVISSLLDNAMKFTEKGKIAVSLNLQDVYAVVKVRDCGKGIDPSIMEQLYDKFATRSEGGAGLGLYISRKIVEAHGGSLSGENNEDGGATFAFTLPIDLDPIIFNTKLDVAGK